MIIVYNQSCWASLRVSSAFLRWRWASIATSFSFSKACSLVILGKGEGIPRILLEGTV